MVGDGCSDVGGESQHAWIVGGGCSDGEFKYVLCVYCVYCV